MPNRVRCAIVGLVTVDESGETMSVPPEVDPEAMMLRGQKVHAHASGKRWRHLRGAFHRCRYHSSSDASDPVHSVPQIHAKDKNHNLL